MSKQERLETLEKFLEAFNTWFVERNWVNFQPLLELRRKLNEEGGKD